MTESVITTEHNVVNPVSTDSSGDVVTDSSGNPAGNVIVANHPAQAETATLEGSLSVAGAGVMATFTDVAAYNVLMLSVSAVTTSVDVTV